MAKALAMTLPKLRKRLRAEFDKMERIPLEYSILMSAYQLGFADGSKTQHKKGGKR